MVNRDTYDKTIEELKNIYSHHQGCNFGTALKPIMDIRDKFDIKLIFVGHFSGGKSSLINALIGKSNFLKEGQEPKTSIAAEISYDENESFISYDIKGNKREIDIEKEYNSSEYSHLEYRLNIPALKEISDFTIVDTPGFDVGIEAHAKALSNYIGRGSAYIVVIDQEKGGIDNTTLEFIKEITNYSKQISIIINKCDKITVSDAEKIAESARLTLRSSGFLYDVYTLSKRDSDISDKLISIISKFNPQFSFDNMMVRQLKMELINIEKILEVTKKKIFLDTFDLDRDIDMYTRLNKQLSEEFEKKRNEAKDEYENTVQEIINKIRSSLIANADYVVEAIMCGNKVEAEAIIVEAVRPIMVASMKDMSIKQIDSITIALDFKGMINESEGVDLTDIALNLASNIKNLIESGSFGTKTIEDLEKANSKKNIYHAITGVLAITTNFIAPWLEVIIILLPDIINLLNGIFGESDTDLAKRRYINNLIPQVTSKLYPQVMENVELTTKIVLDEYENMLKEKIESIKNNIVEAQNKKKDKIEDFEKYKTIIYQDIEVIKNIISELE